MVRRILTESNSLAPRKKLQDLGFGEETLRVAESALPLAGSDKAIWPYSKLIVLRQGALLRGEAPRESFQPSSETPLLPADPWLADFLCSVSLPIERFGQPKTEASLRLPLSEGDATRLQENCGIVRDKFTLEEQANFWRVLPEVVRPFLRAVGVQVPRSAAFPASIIESLAEPAELDHVEDEDAGASQQAVPVPLLEAPAANDADSVAAASASVEPPDDSALIGGEIVLQETAELLETEVETADPSVDGFDQESGSEPKPIIDGEVDAQPESQPLQEAVVTAEIADDPVTPARDTSDFTELFRDVEDEPAHVIAIEDARWKVVEILLLHICHRVFGWNAKTLWSALFRSRQLSDVEYHLGLTLPFRRINLDRAECVGLPLTAAEERAVELTFAHFKGWFTTTELKSFFNVSKMPLNRIGEMFTLTAEILDLGRKQFISYLCAELPEEGAWPVEDIILVRGFFSTFADMTSEKLINLGVLPYTDPVSYERYRTEPFAFNSPEDRMSNSLPVLTEKAILVFVEKRFGQLPLVTLGEAIGVSHTAVRRCIIDAERRTRKWKEVYEQSAHHRYFLEYARAAAVQGRSLSLDQHRERQNALFEASRESAQLDGVELVDIIYLKLWARVYGYGAQLAFDQQLIEGATLEQVELAISRPLEVKGKLELFYAFVRKYKGAFELEELASFFGMHRNTVPRQLATAGISREQWAEAAKTVRYLTPFRVRGSTWESKELLLAHLCKEIFNWDEGMIRTVLFPQLDEKEVLAHLGLTLPLPKRLARRADSEQPAAGVASDWITPFEQHAIEISCSDLAGWFSRTELAGFFGTGQSPVQELLTSLNVTDATRKQGRIEAVKRISIESLQDGTWPSEDTIHIRTFVGPAVVTPELLHQVRAVGESELGTYRHHLTAEPFFLIEGKSENGSFLLREKAASVYIQKRFGHSSRKAVQRALRMGPGTFVRCIEDAGRSTDEWDAAYTGSFHQRFMDAASDRRSNPLRTIPEPAISENRLSLAFGAKAEPKILRTLA